MTSEEYKRFMECRSATFITPHTTRGKTSFSEYLDFDK